MRPVSRLLSVLLALVLLGASLLTVSAHDDSDIEDDDNYGVTLGITRTDNKTSVRLGTMLSFNVVIVRAGEHNILSATLSSVTPGGYAAKVLDLDGKDGIAMDVKYRVSTGDLPTGTTARIVPIRFKLTFTPEHSDNSTHNAVTVVSNEELVPVTRTVESDGDETSEVEIFVDMEPPNELVKGKKVEFTFRIRTGKYGLRSSRILYVRKQLYDEDGDKLGGSTRAVTFTIRPYKSRSLSDDFTKSYTLKQTDEDAATIEFTYEFTIEDVHLRHDDGSPPDLESDFEEVYEDRWVLGAAAATPTPGPSVSPTPQPVTLVGRTSEARVTRVSNNRIHFDVTRGQDFSMFIGFIAADGTRGYHRSGYIRDEGLGQTYAVVNRESDNRVVRIWIAPDSEARYQVPWQDVLDFWTFPQSVVNAIPLDEMFPADNQLVDVGGNFYVYTSGAWRHIPDIPTFQARGYFWCDITSADANFLSRVRVGRALQPSGTAEIPNYPNCRE